MKKLKILLLGALAISGMLAFTSPASAADWRYDHRRAEINRDLRDAWRRREAFERDRRFSWWNRDDRRWADRYAWRNRERFEHHWWD